MWTSSNRLDFISHPDRASRGWEHQASLARQEVDRPQFRCDQTSIDIPFDAIHCYRISFRVLFISPFMLKCSFVT